MLTRVEGESLTGRRHECIGYATFTAAHNSADFATWFARLGAAIARLPEERPARMTQVHNALIDLIDFLDPEHARFQRNRDRL